MPDEALVASGATPGGNRLYADLRGTFDWNDARRTLREDRVIARHLRSLTSYWAMREEASCVLAERAGIDPETYWLDQFEASPFSHLDVGVASSVVALVALGAAPIISCNGGIFDDAHFHPHPLVAFFAPTEAGDMILDAARTAKLHIEQNEFTKSPMIASLRIEPFFRFASILCKSNA